MTTTVEVPVIEFVAPLPGFPDLDRFVLDRVGDSDLLYTMTSVEHPEVRFLVAPPAPFFPGYGPEIDDEALAALGAGPDDADDLLVLLVITAGDAPHAATANLLAPIVVHHPNRRAIQLVLIRSGLPVRAGLGVG